MKILDKKLSLPWLIAMLVVGSLIGASFAVTALSNNYLLPQTANIPSELSVKITVDGVVWNNGSSINWGSVMPGQTYTKPVIILNNGTNAITSITMSSDTGTGALPTGWTETLSAFTGTLNPSGTATGTITLIVSPIATTGSYSWNHYILTT